MCKIFRRIAMGETLWVNGWITTELTTIGMLVYFQWRIRAYWKPAKFHPSPWEQFPF